MSTLNRITWFVNAIKIGDTEEDDDEDVIHIGYCHYGKGVSHISFDEGAEVIGFSTANSSLIDEDKKKCSESKNCLNLSCPLNDYKLKYFEKYGIKTIEELKNLHELLKEVSSILDLETYSKKDTDWGCFTFEEPPITI